MEKRLFIVSNRLPVNVETNGTESVLKPSSGGLVSAISSYLEKESHEPDQVFDKQFWVGVPGCTPGVWSSVKHGVSAEGYEYVPVFVNKKSYDAYYNGTSNSVLWSLFHYFPSFAEFNGGHYEQYKYVNGEFLNVLIKYLQPNDVVWIHDYHLLPLAAMIRQAIPEITIGFFLHIPFPSFEIFRIMPKRWQRELLEGVLGADLIGFHTTDYALHFLKCVHMILGVEHDMYTLSYQNRLVRIGIFPISIDFYKFYDAYDKPVIQKLRTQMRKQFPDKKIIFSADRLDYTKGVNNRLKAYEYFLRKYPEYHEQVVFVMVIVPSRDVISRYAERKKMIDEYIANLNSRVGNFRWQPIIYQYNSLGFDELCSMYTCCDLALITPIRDGMNLVAKEFVASRKDGQGVLVLSEMTGAAKELTEALTISPSDIEEIAMKIKQGLEMGEEEQEQRIRIMQEKIKSYDVVAWATDFFDHLRQVKSMKQYYEVHFLDVAEKRKLLEQYTSAGQRLLLLDYDGTLTPLVSMPHLAAPDDHLLELLQQLAADKRNVVYIISGRDAQTLQEWLGQLPVGIVAEHGALIKMPGSQEWEMADNATSDWMKDIHKIIARYVRNCSGSFVESKLYSIAWHYRNVDNNQALIYAAELYNELQACAMHLNIQVIKGNKVIEVRNKGVNKGAAIKSILKHATHDFILACGDDTTDEDMFSQLADVPGAITVKVGDQASYARFNLHTPEMIRSLLQTLGNVQHTNTSMV